MNVSEMVSSAAHYIRHRGIAKKGMWVEEDKKTLLKHAYFQYKVKPWKIQWRLNLSDKTSVDHAVVTTEDTGFLVSILKEPNQNEESYVEINVTEGHHMFERISDAISVLNIAGALTEVSGVGEMFQEGVYHVILTKEEHTAFLRG